MQNNLMGMLMGMVGGGQGGNMNPMQLMNMMQNNPMMGRAKEMANGKTPDQMEQMCRNMCKQSGIDFDQIKGMASQFGLKL